MDTLQKHVEWVSNTETIFKPIKPTTELKRTTFIALIEEKIQVKLRGLFSICAYLEENFRKPHPYRINFSKKQSKPKLNPKISSVNFLHLSNSRHVMHKVVALNDFLETLSRSIVLEETHQTICNDEFANFEELKGCIYRSKKRLSLFIGKVL